jgi:putrescine transport system permease protein
MRLYSQVRLGVNPEINAVSTLLIGLVATGVTLAYLVQQRRGRRLRRTPEFVSAGNLLSIGEGGA